MSDIIGTYRNSFTGYQMQIIDTAPKPKTFRGIFSASTFNKDTILGTFAEYPADFAFSTAILFSSESNDDTGVVIVGSGAIFKGKTGFLLNFTITDSKHSGEFKLYFDKI